MIENIPKFLKNIERPWKMLAPMVSNSEEAYRDLSRKYGAQICYTEMVHCKVFNQSKSNPINNSWYSTSETDRPLVIQICGNDVKEMLKTCLTVQNYCDAIDINFGCPQDIARKGFYGSFLMDDWELIKNIVSTLSKNISVPLFCKIRVYESIEKTILYAKMIEEAGCSLLVVHGRTREQRGQNTGYASFLHMREVKKALKIPVVANGGMIFYENIQECLDFTGCDGVMIAEPHLYNPTIFVGDCIDNKIITCFDILQEYFEIISKFPIKASQKHIKSHCFKILKKLLEFIPDYREKLDKCYKINEYLIFLDNLKKKALEIGLSEEEFRMAPYIRKEYEIKRQIE